MSPARTRRQPVPKHRDRRELLIAIGSAAAVVLGTALMVWLLRPGPPGTEGTGGLANRQPRAAWLVGLTIVALVLFAVWAIRQQRRWQDRTVIALLVGSLVIVLLAVLAGFVWPGGLLRHTTPVPEVDPGDLSTTTLPPELTTTVPGETTVPPTTPAPTSAPGP
jgi:hypothetical protein